MESRKVRSVPSVLHPATYLLQSRVGDGLEVRTETVLGADRDVFCGDDALFDWWTGRASISDDLGALVFLVGDDGRVAGFWDVVGLPWLGLLARHFD